MVGCAPVAGASAVRVCLLVRRGFAWAGAGLSAGVEGERIGRVLGRALNFFACKQAGLAPLHRKHFIFSEE